MTIRISKYFQFAILVLFFGFSSMSFAVDYYWRAASNAATDSSSPTGACQKWAAMNGWVFQGIQSRSPFFDCLVGATPPGGVNSSAARLGDSCPAGTTYNSANGSCSQSCSITGQVNDATGACVCPSGQLVNGSSQYTAFDYALGRSAAGYSPLSIRCESNADNCARRAANRDEFIYSKNISTNQNCNVACMTRITSGSSTVSYSCSYTGTPVTNTPVQACTDSTGKTCAQEAGTNVNSNMVPSFVAPPPSGGCPSGSYAGTVNGVSGCASSAGVNSSGALPQQTTGATGSSNTQVTSSTTTTTTLSNGSSISTTVTNTTGQLGTPGNPLQTQSAGAHTCDPTAANYAQCIGMGNGQASGAGDCDPTSDNYFQCTGVLQTAPEDGGQSILTEARTGVQQNINTDADNQIADINAFRDSEIGAPEGAKSRFADYIPSSTSCSPMVISFTGHPVTIACDKFEDFKQLFGWFLIGCTIWAIKEIAMKPVGD